MIPAHPAAIALLNEAIGNGGGLEMHHVEGKADALAECVKLGWLKDHFDPAREPAMWFTVTEAGERRAGQEK